MLIKVLWRALLIRVAALNKFRLVPALSCGRTQLSPRFYQGKIVSCGGGPNLDCTSEPLGRVPIPYGVVEGLFLAEQAY